MSRGTTVRPHPAVGRRWLDDGGRRWPVRRAWPAGDGVLALELDDAGGVLGATVDGDGCVTLVEDDDALPTLANWRARHDACVIAHRPGRRAVVRVVDGAAHRYVKIAKPRATMRACERVAVTAGLLASVAGAPALAAATAHDTAAGEISLHPLPGAALGRLVERGTVTVARRAGAVTGAALAAVAACAPAGLGDHTVDDEAAVLQRWVGDAVGYGAVTGPAADRLRAQRDGALDDLAGCDGSERAVLCHRDLHDGQLLVPADRRSPVGVLDWDTATGASPALDLGNLLAHLDRLAVRRPLTARAATDALLGAAVAAGHPACTGHHPAVLAAWRAVAAVRIAAVHAFR